MKNLVLIGPMGCGKSTLGLKASVRLGTEFIDMDKFIEERAGMTIVRMFEVKGEEYFRDKESEAALILAKKRGAIIACGGGVVLRERNMDALVETCCIVFVDRPLEDILNDVETGGRPLLSLGAEKLREIYSDRYSLYKQYADRVIRNDGSQEDAVRRLVEIGEIYKNTQFAVLGDPIEHSKSPEIHLPVLRCFLDDPVYERMTVKCGALPQYLDRLRELRGFNLTMPHKRDIIPYLSDISHEAKLSGSVNTVVCRSGEFFGYTTDGEGFFSSLESAGVNFDGKHLVVLGAGGAARAIVFRACLRYNLKVSVLARDETKARNLRDEVMEKIQAADIYAGGMSPGALARHAASADILVNATPLGMRGTQVQWDSLDFIEKLPENAAICDLIYSPPETELLAKARQEGLKCVNGLPMLIYQALAADELFLDMDIDRECYYETAVQSLGTS